MPTTTVEPSPGGPAAIRKSRTQEIAELDRLLLLGAPRRRRRRLPRELLAVVGAVGAVILVLVFTLVPVQEALHVGREHQHVHVETLDGPPAAPPAAYAHSAVTSFRGFWPRSENPLVYTVILPPAR